MFVNLKITWREREGGKEGRREGGKGGREEWMKGREAKCPAVIAGGRPTSVELTKKTSRCSKMV